MITAISTKTSSGSDHADQDDMEHDDSTKGILSEHSGTETPETIGIHKIESEPNVTTSIYIYIHIYNIILIYIHIFCICCQSEIKSRLYWFLKLTLNPSGVELDFISCFPSFIATRGADRATGLQWLTYFRLST